MSGLRISPFVSMMIGLLFVFSTAYGLMFYYYQGVDKAQSGGLIPLGETPNDPTTIGNTDGGVISTFVSGVASGIIDTILSLLAWVSPFALIRGLVLAVAPSDLFQVLDVFLLRPVSWAVSILTANWIIAKIRGTSEGT